MNCETCPVQWDSPTVVTWDPSLLTGVKHIDDDHREMFARIAEFTGTGCGKDPERVASFVRHLIRYVEAHFESEEILMEASDYPGWEEHRRQHEIFAAEFRRRRDAELLGLADRDCAGPLIVQWATSWLREHIRTTDAAMAVHVAAAMKNQRSAGPRA